jgi:N-methylhydantoinase A
VPVIDLAEVSAGGGSIAWIDPGGALWVGPASAGAEPGPVCYGQGGERPTVTDADLVLGYLNPGYLLGGELKVHLDKAWAAIETRVARPLGLGVLEAAAAFVDVVNAGMAGALRVVSVERGYDPREFSLVAFGGAGPVYAARLAQELEIPEVIVPPIPGGFSALGLVATDLRRDYARTFYSALASVDRNAMSDVYAGMESSARQMLRRAGVPEDRWAIARAADLRYRRQAYELTVPVAPGPISGETLAGLTADFHEKHRITYGHASEREPVQLVNLRLSAVGKLEGLDFSRQASQPARLEATSRAVYFKETGRVTCDVVGRESLVPGRERSGPLIVEAMDTTIVVPPGWRLRVDAVGFVVLEEADHASA